MKCPLCLEELTKRQEARLEPGWETAILDVPAHLRDGLLGYVVHNHEPGHFLTACLSDEFVDAATRADAESVASLRAIAVFIYNFIPANSWGGEAFVKRWVDEEGDESRSCETLAGSAKDAQTFTLWTTVGKDETAPLIVTPDAFLWSDRDEAADNALSGNHRLIRVTMNVTDTAEEKP